MLRSQPIIRIFVIIFAFALQLLLSSRIHSMNVRIFQNGPRIVFSKSSPPIAALEDERLAPLSSEDMGRKVAVVQTAKKAIKNRIAFMKPFRIERPSVFSKTVRVHELKINSGEALAENRPLVAPIEVKGFVSNLPENIRARAENASNLDTWVRSDWSEGSVSRSLEKIIEDEGPPRMPQENSPAAVAMRLHVDPPQAPNSLIVIPGITPASTTAASNAGPLVENVVGSVELDGGPAVLNPDQIKIFHRHDGALLGMAQIDFSRWEFRIPLSREMKGELVAEVRSDTDRLIGTGRIALSDLFRMKRPVLKVRDDSAQTVAVVRSADGIGGGREFPVSDANVQIQGLNRALLKTDGQGIAATKLVESGSTFEWLAHKDGFWSSRSSGHSDWPGQVMLFPNKMMEALFGVLGIQKFDPTKGIIWGQVKNKGLPLEGAEVSLEESELTPVYFSGPFPNLRLSGTSSNGFFAFFQLSPGLHQVRTKAAGIELPTKMVEVQEMVVTTVDVSTSKSLSAQVQTYEGISGAPVTASVQITGTQRLATASEGRLNVRYSEGADPLMLDVFSGPLALTSRISGDRFLKQQMVPVIKISWIEDLLSRAGQMHHSAKSMIVGFIRGKDFVAEVKSSGLRDGDAAAVPLYFDVNGNPLAGSTTGIAGGGFIFTNLPPEGFASVFISNADGGGNPFIHRMFLDSRVVGVVSKDLGSLKE